MSKGSPKSEAGKVGNLKVDLNDVEMVFGTPNSPRMQKPDVHSINNEKQGRDVPKVNPARVPSEGESEPASPSQPLLEPERGPQQPPLAGPEIDDLGEDKPTDAAPYPGIDDGLLDQNDKKPQDPTNDGSAEDPRPEGDPQDKHSTHEDGVNTEDDGYMGNGLASRAGDIDRPISPMIPNVIPDVNTYQQKKNLAQGMMDLALLSANANQLRYVLESAVSHPYYYPSLVFIACSIILQIAVGVGLILNSRYNVKDEKDICKADKINNMTVLGIFLITIVNVFITSFSVATPTVITTTTAIQPTG